MRPASINILKRLFADSPHNVLIAASAAEALELLSNNSVP